MVRKMNEWNIYIVGRKPERSTTEGDILEVERNSDVCKFEQCSQLIEKCVKLNPTLLKIKLKRS